MATSPPRSPIIAVDTNVPLDLADQKEHTLDALDVIWRRLKPGRILVTPTVFQELVYLAEDSGAEAECGQARRALRAPSFPSQRSRRGNSGCLSGPFRSSNGACSGDWPLGERASRPSSRDVERAGRP